MKTLTKLFIAIVLFSVACFGQTALTTTTLSAAVTATQNTFTVASATGITGTGAANQVNTMLYVDRELVRVLSVASTVITVQRAVTQVGSIQAAHVSGATVWIGAPAAFTQRRAVNGAASAITEGGACVRTQLVYVPLVDVSIGAFYDCLGLTTAGRFVRVDAPSKMIAGTTVASATTINPTGNFFVVSGTTAIATITVPAGWGTGMCLEINPSGIWATTTAGNIGLVSSASVVGRIMFMCWDGASTGKWWPSYVS